MAAATLVFLSYLLRLGTSLPWIGLALAFLPFPLRRARQGHLMLITPLDLPIAVFVAGAMVGLIVSPESGLSLGAFQSTLALLLFYYSWVNHPRLPSVMKSLIILGLLAALGQVIFVAVERPGRLTTPDSLEPTYHGLALALVIVAAILFGVAIFGKRTRTRIASGLICLALLGTVSFLVQESVPRLFSGESVDGRLPRWETTASLLYDSPLTGLGLGAWALTYHGTEVITHPTHAHNAYLELYANHGILGALSLVLFLVIGGKLAWDIARSPRNHPWYGFGIGVLLAGLATLIIGVVESAPIGVPLVEADSYRYIVSPAPWILAGLLVAVHRLLSKAA